MSKYTTQLRWIVEQTLNDAGKPLTEDSWPYVYKTLGLDDYPLFDETYRETLNNKIIRHYYTREIGAETVGRFRMFIRDAMHLIMPYYNQLYESERLAKGMEPLGDRNLQHTEHAWGNASNKGENSSQSSANQQNVFQDTPQNEMIPTQIKNLQYATGTSSSSGEYDNMVERLEKGYSRPQSELLQLYRDTFLNIDNSIVHDVELAQCFMTIW
jgi:hypothetical protein